MIAITVDRMTWETWWKSRVIATDYVLGFQFAPFCPDNHSFLTVPSYGVQREGQGMLQRCAKASIFLMSTNSHYERTFFMTYLSLGSSTSKIHSTEDEGFNVNFVGHTMHSVIEVKVRSLKNLFNVWEVVKSKILNLNCTVFCFKSYKNLLNLFLHWSIVS